MHRRRADRLTQPLRSGCGRARPARRVAALCGLVFVLVLGGQRSVAGPQDEITRRDWGIAGFRAPPRWDLLPNDRPSYPQLLAWASRGEGTERSVITLVARRVPAGTTHDSLLNEARALKLGRAESVQVKLEREVTQRRVLVEAELLPTKTERRQVLRQILLLNPPFAYALTLVAPFEQRQARQRDLEETASNLIMMAPEREEAPRPPPPPAPPPDAASPPAPVPVDGGAGPVRSRAP
ncbi:MAG: hypothetical protein U1A78_21855 [Polyangia bacterium]